RRPHASDVARDRIPAVCNAIDGDGPMRKGSSSLTRIDVSPPPLRRSPPCAATRVSIPCVVSSLPRRQSAADNGGGRHSSALRALRGSAGGKRRHGRSDRSIAGGWRLERRRLHRYELCRHGGQQWPWANARALAVGASRGGHARPTLAD